MLISPSASTTSVALPTSGAFTTYLHENATCIETEIRHAFAGREFGCKLLRSLSSASRFQKHRTPKKQAPSQPIRFFLLLNVTGKE